MAGACDGERSKWTWSLAVGRLFIVCVDLYPMQSYLGTIHVHHLANRRKKGGVNPRVDFVAFTNEGSPSFKTGGSIGLSTECVINRESMIKI
jgi:hypothetical protein